MNADNMSIEELRAFARDLIRRLPDEAVRQLLDEVLADRVPDPRA